MEPNATRREFLKQTGGIVAGAAAAASAVSQQGRPLNVRRWPRRKSTKPPPCRRCTCRAGTESRWASSAPPASGRAVAQDVPELRPMSRSFTWPTSTSITSATQSPPSLKNTANRPRRRRTCAHSSTTATSQAVFIATPDHWHAPATILACDAGKHVYVEKPCSHNIREGRLMIEAARRSTRSCRSARRAAAPSTS